MSKETEELMKEREAAAIAAGTYTPTEEEGVDPIIPDEPIDKIEPTEPVDPIPPAETTNAATFDFSKFGVTTTEELETKWNELNEKTKTFEQTISEKILRETQLSEEKATLSKQLEAAKLSEDADMARLAILKNTKDPRYKDFAQLVFNEDKLDNRSLLLLEHKKMFPDESVEKINKFIDRKYGLNIQRPDQDDEDAVAQYEETIEMAEMQMKTDAQLIKAKMKAEFESIEVPIAKPVSVEQISLEKAKAKEGWIPVAPKLAEIVGDMSQTIKVDNKEIKVSFKIPAEEIALIEKDIIDYAYENGITYNEQSVEHLASLARDVINKRNQGRLVAHSYEEGYKAAMKFAEEKYAHLRGGKGIPTINQGQPTGINNRQAYLDYINSKP